MRGDPFETLEGLCPVELVGVAGPLSPLSRLGRAAWRGTRVASPSVTSAGAALVGPRVRGRPARCATARILVPLPRFFLPTAAPPFSRRRRLRPPSTRARRVGRGRPGRRQGPGALWSAPLRGARFGTSQAPGSTVPYRLGRSSPGARVRKIHKTRLIALPESRQDRRRNVFKMAHCSSVRPISKHGNCQLR